MERPAFWTTYGGGLNVPQECRVVYIHPEERFYVVEFQNPVTGETFRQSCYFEGRRGTGGEEEKDFEDNSDHEQQGRCRENGYHHQSGRHLKPRKKEALYHF